MPQPNDTAVTQSEWMRIGEVARAFEVHPLTLRRWEEAGKLKPTRTLGGQRRYLRSDVEALLQQMRGVA